MSSQITTNRYLHDSTNLPQSFDFKQTFTSQKNHISHLVLNIRRGLTTKRSTHSDAAMKSAGFTYINNGDTTRCTTCELEISDWTFDMKPFTIHSQRSPACPFVRSTCSSHEINTSATQNFPLATSSAAVEEPPLKRMKTNTTDINNSSNTFVEVDTLKQVRKRTFSHWPHRSSPSISQMIEAGFFKCNVGDRVICVYCNLICQQWTPNIDDPCEIHKTLSPKCPYVVSMLTRSQTSTILVINEHSTNNQASASANADSFRCDSIVHTAACNTAYIEIPKRYASFANWPNENSPAVDDLVKAGFFYTGTKTIVTCFYCNGSLQNWTSNDNPTMEHVRWFPHCAYAKQLCDTELYRKIQESKRVQQERIDSNKASNRSETSADGSTHRQLVIPDENILSRLVAARLDLPISQSLLNRNFKLSIIKRCWEDQLRLKREDFVSDSDLLMACTILQKQIQHIDGKKENIVIPSVAMKQIREREQAASLSTNSSNSNDVEMSTSLSESISDSASSTSAAEMQEKEEHNKVQKGNVSGQNEGKNSSPTNPCVLCLEEEKRLACIPCGHLATCVPCGHSLRSCPICRRGIDAFVRIYT